MKKVGLTLSIMIVGALAVSQSTTADTILQESKLVSDYEEDSSQPHGPEDEWRYYTTDGGDDPQDPSNWVSMTWSSGDNRWEGQDASWPARWNGTRARPTNDDTIIFTWEAAVDGTAEVYFEGGGGNETGTFSVDLYDQEFDLLAEVEDTTSFTETVSDVTVEEGENLTFITTASNSNQKWAMTSGSIEYGAWRPDGLQDEGAIITVIPEPSTLVILGLAGLLLMKRRRL